MGTLHCSCNYLLNTDDNSLQNTWNNSKGRIGYSFLRAGTSLRRAGIHERRYRHSVFVCISWIKCGGFSFIIGHYLNKIPLYFIWDKDTNMMTSSTFMYSWPPSWDSRPKQSNNRYTLYYLQQKKWVQISQYSKCRCFSIVKEYSFKILAKLSYFCSTSYLSI